ncbi:MAG: hypothetical protein NWS37_06385 [Flavobacteriaceae bacterium]|nr:hypothetical protein [Flavobacteriaceae bacterium]
MLIHLYNDDIHTELFQDILVLLNTQDGPLEFVAAEHDYEDVCHSMSANYAVNLNEEEFEKKLPVGVAWKTLLNQIARKKQKCKLPGAAPFFFFTRQRNELNWFSFGNEYKNHYIHCDHWDYFIESDQRYPIAFLVASDLLQSFVYQNMENVLKAVHQETKGCLMDLCINKRDINMKMRTADCCSDCMDDIKEAINDGRLEAAHYLQLMSILESIRQQLLFKSRYTIERKPSELKISGRNKNMHFVQLGNLELKLNPLERTLYLFFLNHPEGVKLNELADEEYYNEIYKIYQALSVVLDKEQIKFSVDQLCNPLENSASEKISRINSKIKRALGEELAQNYLITGARGEAKSIDLDRKYLLQSA